MLLDKSQKPWIIAVCLFALVATAAYFIDAANRPEHIAGGSTAVGLTLGVVAYVFMWFCAALGLKRRIPHWRLGKAQTWLRGHVWLGLLISVLVVLHSGFSFRTVGWGSLSLWIMLAVVTISGVIGIFIQQTIPRILWAALRSPRAASRDPVYRPSMNPESPAQQIKEMLADCEERARLLAGRFSGKYLAPVAVPPPDRMKETDAAQFDFSEPCPPMPPPAPPVATAPAVPAPAAAAPKPAVPAAPATAATPAATPAAPAPVAAAGSPVPPKPAAPAPSPAPAPAPAPSTAPAAAPAAGAAVATAAAAPPKPATPVPAAAAAPKPPPPPPAPKAPQGAEPIRQFYLNVAAPFFANKGGFQLLNETSSGSVFEALRTACPTHLHAGIDDLEELADRRRMLMRQRRWMRVLHGWLIIHVPVSWAFIVAVAIHAVYSLMYWGKAH
ncbi:MAG: hypothetical protein ACT4PL_13110 [Phycisphaerales bacterium]